MLASVTGFSKRQRFGLEAEQWAVKQLTRMGYTAWLVSLWTAKYDILIDNLLHCEVKISRQSLRKVRRGYYRPTWYFDVARIPEGLDIAVILICEDDRGQWWPYIVPSWLLWKRVTTSITSHPTQYSGYLAGCLNNWGNIDMVMTSRLKHSAQLQLPLDGWIQK